MNVCVVYGSAGPGSELARQLAPVVAPEARWSGLRVPSVDSPGATTPHALIIDDLLLFRQVRASGPRHATERASVRSYVKHFEESEGSLSYLSKAAHAKTPDVTAGPPDNRIEVASSPDSAEHGTALETVLERYKHVGLRTKPSKVKDYDAVQDLVGHTLDHNVLRASSS